MRELAVTEAIPQKNWAPITISSRNWAPPEPIASMKIWAGGTPVSLLSAPS